MTYLRQHGHYTFSGVLSNHTTAYNFYNMLSNITTLLTCHNGFICNAHAYTNFSINTNSHNKIIDKFFYSTTNEQADSMSTGKDEFILQEWLKDFPNYDNLTILEIKSLSSRSAKIGNWLTDVNERYQLLIDTPQWYVGDDEDKIQWSEELRAKIDIANKLSADLSVQTNKVSLDTKTKIATLNNNYLNELEKLFIDNHELLIHFITSQVLPIEVHIRAMRVTSKDESKEIIKRELLEYKKKLFSDYNSGIVTSANLRDLLRKKG